MVRPALVNEVAARLAAAVTLAGLGLALALQEKWLLPVIALGFVVRTTLGPRASLLSRVSAWAATRFATPRLVPAGPKRFAQGLGAAMTVAASALLWTPLAPWGWGLTAVVAVCAALEAGLAFCLGCWVYGRLQRLGLLPATACPACAEEHASAH